MGPVWSSGFRPFFLASAIYGPAIIVQSLAASTLPGFAAATPTWGPLWHGHELLCGWAGALIGGFLLTALPSWAGARAIIGPRLAFLFLLWALGRLAMWLQPFSPAPVVAVLDLAFLAFLAAALAPTLLPARQKRYLAVILILVALFCGNLQYHLGAVQGDTAAARFGLQLFLCGLTFLYSVVAGFLTPVFTQDALRSAGHETTIPFNVPLEIAAALSMLLYLIATLAAENVNMIIGAGTAAFLVHAVRMGRWYRPAILGIPLIWVMHLAYAWLLASMLLRVLSAWNPAVPADASVHAFTVGAVGLMHLGLLCRIALRHTGRPVIAPKPVVMGMFVMLAAAGLRVAGALAPAGPLTAAAAVLWVVPLLIFLYCHGRMLLSPSLPTAGRESYVAP
ncbi:MAG: NnrS family protein [Gammaproteobacteria bacterium]|nr:NnrS family protein [Gammaproteobacteria bacterium]